MLSKANKQVIPSAPIYIPKQKLTPVMRSMIQWAMVDTGDRVLDMACGNGAMLQYYAQRMACELCGMASSVDEFRSVRAMLPNADIMYAQPEDIPWKDNSFDVILCSAGISNLENPKKILKEALRVLKPGGQFVLATPWYPGPLRSLMNSVTVSDNQDKLYSYFSKHEMMASLESLGFEKVSWRVSKGRVGITVGWKKPETAGPEVM